MVVDLQPLIKTMLDLLHRTGMFQFHFQDEFVQELVEGLHLAFRGGGIGTGPQELHAKLDTGLAELFSDELLAIIREYPVGHPVTLHCLTIAGQHAVSRLFFVDSKPCNKSCRIVDECDSIQLCSLAGG